MRKGARSKVTNKFLVSNDGLHRTVTLLFGIKGNRWFDPDSFLYPKFKELLNENWVKPLETEKPLVANQIEGGCYW